MKIFDLLKDYLSGRRDFQIINVIINYCCVLSLDRYLTVFLGCANTYGIQPLLIIFVLLSLTCFIYILDSSNSSSFTF